MYVGHTHTKQRGRLKAQQGELKEDCGLRGGEMCAGRIVFVIHRKQKKLSMMNVRVDVSSRPEQCKGPALKELLNDNLCFLPN